MKNRIIALLLSTVMAVSMIACGNTTTPGTTTPSASASESKPSEEVKPENTEPVKISVAGYFFGPVDSTKDEITPAIEARLLEEHGINVDLEIVYLEQANYSELLNTRLAGGTAPDVFLAQSLATMQTMYDQGVIASWDVDFFKENAPDVYNYITSGMKDGKMKDFVDLWTEYSQIDGEMVTIPSLKPTGNKPYKQLIYRGDWLEALGVTEETLPYTVEEFVDLMYRFAKEDPDGNGKADTYGMSATAIKALFGAYGIFSGFVGGSGDWVERDGGLVYSDVTPEAKEVVKILADMYKDGVIDPEFVTGKEAISGSYWATSNGLINGKFGVSALASIDHFRVKGVESEADPGGRVAQEYWAVNGEDSTFVYGPWPAGPNGDYGYTTYIPVAVSESAVYNADLMDDMDKLATIFQILNAFAIDDELYMLAKYGVEGTHYNMVNGMPVMAEGFSDGAAQNEVGLSAVRSLYGPDRAWSDTAFHYVDDTPNNEWQYSIFAKKQYDSYLQNPVYVSLPSEADLNAELNTYRDETWIKMIKGELSVENDWDAYIEQYMKLGGQTLQDEANEWWSSK